MDKAQPQEYRYAGTPAEIEALDEAEFKRRFPQDGFGWVDHEILPNEQPNPGQLRSAAIMKRWKEIEERETNRFN